MTFVSRITTAAALLLGLALPTAHAQIYVDADNTSGVEGGISWGTAYPDLQTALSKAESDDEIWIAEGVYVPDDGSFEVSRRIDGVELYGGFEGNEASRSAREPEKHKTILSGDVDAGTGNSGEDTDPDNDGIIEDASNINGTNAGPVFLFDGAGYGITNNTVIDGLVITAGQSTGEFDGRGGGLVCGGLGRGNKCNPKIVNVTFSGNKAVRGGAMYNEAVNEGESSPEIINGVFVGNSASRTGGAIYTRASENGSNGNPQIIGCTFIDNSSAEYGGAVHNQALDGGTSSPQIKNTVFENNSADLGGGAVFNDGNIDFDDSGGTSSPQITNSVFVGNSAGGLKGGGAIYNRAREGGTSSPTIVNSTFSGNASDKGGAILNDGTSDYPVDGGTSRPHITNVILWGNSATYDRYGNEIANKNATPTLSHTIIEGGLSGINEEDGSSTTDGGGNLDQDPRFADAAAPKGPDGIYATSDDGLHVTSASPALDAGDDDAVPSSVTKDLTGAARTQDQDGDGTATVNIGAYERVRDKSRILRVSAGATGAEDGSSWSDAFSSLNSALSEADANDEIWIAEGVYTPDGKGDSFTITGAKDGLEVYGGFDGSETSRGERDPTAHPTVLSGDLNGDDDNKTASGVTPTWADISGTNADHVLVLDGGENIGTDVTPNITASTVIDGVTVTGGQADGSVPANKGGGLFCDGQGGGNNCSPTIRNVVFVGNTAGRGGALYNVGTVDGNASPSITNAIMIGNSAQFGGAVRNDGRRGTASPQFINVTFAENLAGKDGGALYNWGEFSGGESSPQIINATFTGNAANRRGGAIHNRGPEGTASPTIRNTILWGNVADANEDGTGGGDEIYNDSATPTLGHTIIEGGLSEINENNGSATTDDGGNRSQNPRFEYALLPAGDDGTSATDDDGVHVRPGSPAIDAGNDGAVPSGVTTDVTGASRTQNGTVDIGAYEGGRNQQRTIYAQASAGGNGTGLSWNEAVSSLQVALGAADGNDEVWIAEGVYYPDEGTGIPDAKEDTSFVIPTWKDGLKLYGGFAGDETDRSARDPSAHPTVLSGDLNEDDNNKTASGVTPTASDISGGENAHHVLVLDGNTGGGTITTATVVSGLTVTAGQAEGTGLTTHGGGLFCHGGGSGNECSPRIENVTFRGNEASFGGGLFNNGRNDGTSQPEIVDCVFRGNAATDGGAIVNDGRNFGGATSGSSRSEITNTTFTNNAASRNGGAIANWGSGGLNKATITGVTFTGNAATKNGGAIFNSGDNGGTASPQITGGTFRNNSATFGGAIFSKGVDNGAARPSITNSTFTGNAADTHGGAIQNVGRSGGSTSSVIANVVLANNTASQGGGAIANIGRDNGSSTPTITGATLTDNSAKFGGAIMNTVKNGGTTSPQITNTILWGNAATDGGDEIVNFSTNSSLSHSIVQDGDAGIGNGTGFSSGTANLDQDPQFVDASTPAGTDGIFATSDDGANVTAGSPALDAGTNAALDTTGNGTRDITADLTGAARVQDRDGNGTGTVNIGAYEAASSALVVDGAAPTTAYPGHSVVLTGNALDGASSVTYDGTSVPFSVASASEIRTRLPAGASADGQFEVTTPDDTDTSPTITVQSGAPYGAERALSLDGNGEYVEGPSMDLSGSALTIEAWVKPGQFPNTHHTIAGVDASSNTALLRVGDGSASDTPQFVLRIDGTDVTADASTTLATGTWQHVAGVYDGSEMRLYVDGELVGSTSQSGSVTANDVFRIGRSAGGGSFYGDLDQVRVWTAALSVSELRARAHRTIAPSDAAVGDLAVAYRFDAPGSEPTVFDLSGNFRHGTLQGDAARTAVSGAPLGQESVVTRAANASAGSSGGSLTVENVAAGEGEALRLYQFGRADGPVRTTGEPGEDFSQLSEVNKRLHPVWGLASAGAPSADVTIDYSGVQGLLEPENVRLLKRDGPGAPWQNVSGDWTWNEDAETFSRTGASRFSQYAIGVASSPLPVELARFEGTTAQDGVRLTWTTASEQNNAGFRVQRRVSDTRAPGTQNSEGAWREIEKVKGGGTTEEPQTYRVTDADLPYAADTLRYRLRQIDTDGSVSYSEPIVVGRGEVERLQLLGTYPNPARTRATVRFAVPEETEATAVTMRLYDVLGRRVRTVETSVEPGRHKQRLDVSGLSSGVYVLRLRAGTETRTRKLTVVQ